MSGAALVTGDPGIGKSAVLDAIMAEASDLRVLSVTGFEVESSIPYGAVQRLGRPLADDVDRLPEMQRQALLVASGAAEGRPPERSLVGLAALTLLSAAAEGGPVLCVIDDAHHLDPESLEVLGFIARRVTSEGVGLLFAAREDDGVRAALAGVPTIVLGGLSTTDAVRLLRQALPDRLDPAIESEIVRHTAGNPLALVELSDGWSTHELTLTAIAQTPAPIGARLEAHYARQVAGLRSDARMWILLAAAESAGDPSVLRAAASALGLPDHALAAVERTGLLDVRETVRFRHPLVRSAVYAVASDLDRRTVHAALRDVTAARDMSEFAAWHAAAAASGADDAIAAAFVELADRAGARGAFSSRARLLSRAADLSHDVGARSALLLAAAEAASVAGQARLARELAARVDIDGVDDVGRGRVLLLRAQCAMFLSDPEELPHAPDMLFAAADRFRGVAPELEQQAMLFAFNVISSTQTEDALRHLDRYGRRVAEAAESLPGRMSVALRALSALVLKPYPEAVPDIRAAVDMLRSLDDTELLGFSHYFVTPTVALWDADLAIDFFDRSIAASQRAGALRELDSALWVASAVEISRGNPAKAGDYLDRAKNIRRALGYDAEMVVNAAHLAWTGAPYEVVAQIAEALTLGGYAGAARMAWAGLAIRQLADGEYDAAFARLEDLVARPFVQATYHQHPELVEAGVRSGRTAKVQGSVELMREYASASGAAWALGLSERCEALVSEDGAAEPHYVDSIRHLDRTGLVGEQGRSRLLYGEWLRRTGRRGDARTQLLDAHARLERAGATAFAARARRELSANGESEPTGRESLHANLTPQELAVARLAAAGNTNVEIGAALFISPNTVDYHLRKVFRKLGVTSRRQLIAAFAAL